MLRSLDCSSFGIEFIYKPDLDLPEIMDADEKRLRQVLIILLGNAIKFTDQGSVTPKVELIGQHLAPDLKTIRFQVGNTGMGMAPTP